MQDANPQAVPAVIGRSPSRSARDDVIDAADSAFVNGIRLAELFGFLLVAGTFVFGRVVFPRSENAERIEELDEAADLDPAP